LADIKHIHVFAQSPPAQKVGAPQVPVKLQLNILENLFLDNGKSASQKYTYFILPDQRSAFENFAKEIFASDKPPSNVFPSDDLSPKAVFKKKIVNYTLTIATSFPKDFNEINKYYESILNTPEAQEQIISDYSVVQEQFAMREEKIKQDVALYGASLETDGVVEFSREPDHSQLDLYGEEGNEVDGGHEDEENLLGSGPRVETPENDFMNAQMALFGDKPTEGKHRPVVEMMGMSFEKTKVFSDLPSSSTVKFKGAFGARLIEPVPEPVYFPGDAFLQSENNSGIICSRDELYRPRGHTKSGAVYLYAGRKGSSESQFKNFSNAELERKVEPNNLISDSAYIYLSQKADVDSMFKYKVAKGTYSKAISPLTKKGERETRQGISLAAVKADDVLIMARVSGIRLITGTDKKNSKGGTHTSKFGIDLIAGNDDSDLQPLVKGDNLVKYLSSLSTSIDQLRSVLYDFMNSQSKFNNVIANHRHYDQFGVMMGTVGSNNPFAINGGKGFYSEELMAEGTTSLLETIRQQYNTVTSVMNRIGNDINGLERMGAYKILSEKNRTN